MYFAFAAPESYINFLRSSFICIFPFFLARAVGKTDFIGAHTSPPEPLPTKKLSFCTSPAEQRDIILLFMAKPRCFSAICRPPPVCRRSGDGFSHSVFFAAHYARILLLRKLKLKAADFTNRLFIILLILLLLLFLFLCHNTTY